MKVDTRTGSRDGVPHSMLDFMRLNAKLADLDIPALQNNTGNRLPGQEKGTAPVLQLHDLAPVYRRFVSALNTHVYLENSRETPPSLDEYELLCYCMISGDTLAEGIKRAIKFVSALNGRGG